MKNTVLQNDWYGREKISKILLKVAPPVMLAQLIQALYNIVDSFFVGMYSNDALTALSVIYPMQLVIIALAVGTGVGVNTYMARKYAQERPKDAEAAAGCGTVLALVSWALFAALSLIFMRPYVKTSATSPEAVEYAVIYGNIVCAGSIGVFLEGNWTKVHQARGNMRRPMIAQITGALTNIILDPILIFGIGPAPEMAVIVSVGAVCKPPELRHMRRFINRIYFFGYSSILMQLLYTVYILALNIILAGFSDAAVTVLGLYYKLQSFFFIPTSNVHRAGPQLQLCKGRRTALPSDDEFVLPYIVGVHAARHRLLCFLPRSDDPPVFRQLSSHRNRENRLSDNRCGIRFRGIRNHHAHLLSGDRQGRAEHVPFPSPSDILPYPDILGILARRTQLHMARFSAVRNDLGCRGACHVPCGVEKME